ncbi:Fc receptor-like protein 5 [Astyanax mexicanus]|uniref:Fc receptor-like protein 5 n=1 Tax=Astyanax mexicanus TaxID=7994 RepID=A0A8T2M8V3_ASTMX|nr:Fc receptor-like protein 5 [Astyanax mexicanus]
MKSFFLIVVIVLSSLVKQGTSDDEPLVQLTLSIGSKRFHREAVELLNTTAVQIQVNVTSTHDSFHNSTVAVENPENGISVRGNSTDHSEEGHVSTGSWVWVVCAIVIILLLIPVILLLVPSFRQRMFFPVAAPTGVSTHQEMPQTKQDATEIQWDLAWMEMANLLDKQHYPGS